MAELLIEMALEGPQPATRRPAKKWDIYSKAPFRCGQCQNCDAPPEWIPAATADAHELHARWQVEREAGLRNERGWCVTAARLPPSAATGSSHSWMRAGRREVRAWRTEDIEQRVLNNAVLLWERYAESNRRFVEERSEQMKSFANLSALITGFAIVSFLQVGVHEWVANAVAMPASQRCPCMPFLPAATEHAAPACSLISTWARLHQGWTSPLALLWPPW